MEIRNIAIIAHVDHGKTTLVDGFLKQTKTFRDNESYMQEDLLMDSNDQERERGITILAKNTSINYKDVKINIIDTPGHADFGGEVERTLNMAEGAVLVIDAQEGPMPQTKFVLKKALELGLTIMVVINKIDKAAADIKHTINRIYDLFLDLATDQSQLDFPIYYAVARDGKGWKEMPKKYSQAANLFPILDGIIEFIPAPVKNDEGPFQMLISSLFYDNYLGKCAVGKIKRGSIKPGDRISLLNEGSVVETKKIEKIFQNAGMKRLEVTEAFSGDIISLAGLDKVTIGSTLTHPDAPEPLPTIDVEEPTLSISVYANTSPFAGREGTYVTARQLLDRIQKELETNISMRMEFAPDATYVLKGRGELHLAVFIETLRREGFELEVGKPKVITKVINGVLCEPIEELIIDVQDEYVNAAVREVSCRKGVLHIQDQNSDSSTRLIFKIPTRGTLGLRNALLNATRGNMVMHTLFLKYAPYASEIPKLRKGVLVSFLPGRAVAYGINNAQSRGVTFIHPQTDVYEGMIVGLNCKDEDLNINVTKEKKQTNMRASGSDEAIVLTPPTIMSLEQCLDFLEDDELLEVTPKSLRLRKKVLESTARAKIRARKESGRD